MPEEGLYVVKGVLCMNGSVFKEGLFKGKKVFITGGATGMGLGFSRAFLEHGANVFIASSIVSRFHGRLKSILLSPTTIFVVP